MALNSSLLLLLALPSAYSASTPRTGAANSHGPTVLLDNGTFVGVPEGSVSAFRGIPYAKPPVGDLRFRLPVANDPYNGTYNVTTFGASCIQQLANDTDPSGQNSTAIELLHNAINGYTVPVIDDEDCLIVNVHTPANATANSRLPVVYWIYGGGFQAGSITANNGSVIVERSLQLEEPVVYVSVNYRLSVLGFPGSSEVREAGIGNLGLHDQRLGLRWVQKYISAFGGDPSKVTIWGQSAGAISVAMQMFTNGGNNEGLFRGAFLQSGGPFDTGALEDGQASFNKFATDAGCVDSLGSAAVFDCLRNASIADIRAAIQASQNIFDYASLALPWKPRVDGVFLTDTPQQLVLNGSVADVPFVIGDCDDEGTLFSLSNTNITTGSELRQYLQDLYFPTANDSLIDNILSAYPDDPALGSPFDTPPNNSFTPEYKRISAISGDHLFQAPRRLLLSERSGLNSSAFSYLYKRGKSTPYLGASHGNDVFDIYSPGDTTDALVNFAMNLDPNGKTLVDWPEYTVEAPVLLTLSDGNVTQAITNDTYRAEGMRALIEASLAGPY
ncbi:carotenoid ester lipase precursor [Peniophora sp. CONT]|nr:carotenoid ester lipase precursor [Peniophora sp. CONT]